MNRKEARYTLAQLLSAALVGEGKPVQAVYPYQVGDFHGQSPVVVVCSGGSDRSETIGVGRAAEKFTLHIHVFALYSTPGKSISEEDAESTLDDIEDMISACIQSNQESFAWRALTAEPSETSSIDFAGVEYRTEMIRVLVS